MSWLVTFNSLVSIYCSQLGYKALYWLPVEAEVNRAITCYDYLFTITKSQVLPFSNVQRKGKQIIVYTIRQNEMSYRD